MLGRANNYIWWVAWRHLSARHRRAGLSFMTVVSILGVAIGVAALIIVLSVMGGFEQDLKDKMLRGMPHLEVVNSKAAVGFSLLEHPIEKFTKIFPEAIDAEAFTQADVVIKQKRHISSAIIFGVDPTRDGHLWGFGGAMKEGNLKQLQGLWPAAFADAEGEDSDKPKRPGIALGMQLAEQLSAEVGDELTVLSPQAGVESALGAGTVSRRYIVIGKFQTGLFNYDAKWAVVSLDEGRKFMPDYDQSLDDEKYVTGVAINFADPFAIERMESRLQALAKKADSSDDKKPTNLSGLEPLSWQKVNKSLLFALKLEKFAMGSILMLIVVVACFSISGTMMMIVFHRRGQVSLLRSLGMSRQAIAKLFLTHGFTIGTIGIGIGFSLGIMVCALIRSFQFISLPAGVYHLKSLPCKWLWLDYGLICVLAWIFSLIAATYPALTAAKQDPGQGLRYL